MKNRKKLNSLLRGEAIVFIGEAIKQGSLTIILISLF